MFSFAFLVSFFLLPVVPPVVSAGSRYVRTVSREVAQNQTYDFIIVGGGTSGLTVADRLTENPQTTVLVIEYGPLDNGEPAVQVPGLLNLTSSPYFFDLKSAPQAGLNNGSFMVPAAAVVGGGTIVNGMFFDRGSAADYNAWTELGAVGWGWTDLLPYFIKSEKFTPAAQDFANEFEISWDESVHGKEGPVQSSYPVFQFPVIKNFFRAWHSLGVATSKDPGDGNAKGVFWAPSSLDPKDQTRSSARTAHYSRVNTTRENYHLLTNSAVYKIRLEGQKAVGVEYLDRATNKSTSMMATKEVILAAGSIHTPQILQLSGIGPEDLLKEFRIETKVDLPGVGLNFQDHPTLYATFNFSVHLTPDLGALGTNKSYAEEQLTLYYSQRQGPYTIVNQGGNTVAFLPLPNITSDYQSLISLAHSQSLPDIYPAGSDPSIQAGYATQREIILRLYAGTDTSVQETGYNGASVIPITLVKPLSRGSVHIKSDSILDRPIVDWGSLSDPTDLETLIAALKLNRKLVASPPMQELGPVVELSPGANVTTDAQLRVALRHLVVPTYSHPCCTCAMMGKELGGVVDPGLSVYGVGSLSIVDASIIPLIPATHTSATVYAVAEKAADIIKARHGIV
ncbi:MAG: hypothetical protein M1814_002150 [Vezdaea aestivalis]|nr:MAG: hypothetical protein M1814_002150 [Vezdaea aestivalis]